MGDFWQRLKQRKLVQWAIAYGAFAFALVQVLDVVADSYDLPHSAMHLLFGALVLGFVVVLVLAWYHGEKGQQRFSGPEILILALLLALGGGLLWHYAPTRPADKTTTATSAKSLRAVAAPSSLPPATTRAFAPPPDTLVVLPFTNLGGDPGQQYFSDGITEELTNALGQNTGLRVIAWDTASKFHDSKQSATDIGKTLDVANVLRGKILHQGNEVRVIVELVNAANGYQVWASHYDDSLSNIFQVQDKISAAIADALKVKFAATRAAKPVNPQAYDLVQQARALMDKADTAAPYEQAGRLLQQAIARDPDYADAHALLARAWFALIYVSRLPFKDALSRGRAETEQALALDPRNVDALVALGDADVGSGHTAEAKAEFEQALAIDPSNANAHMEYGNVLPLEQALAQALKAVRLDPDNVAAQNNLTLYYLFSGEYQQALVPALAAIKLDPHSTDAGFGVVQIYALLHRNEDAVKAFDLVDPDTDLDKALVSAGRLTYRSLLNPALHGQALAAVDAVCQRSDLNPDSMGAMALLYLALGQNDTVLGFLPQMCTTAPGVCAGIGVNPLWAPLHGDPRFEALVKKVTSQASVPAASASSSP